MTLQNLFAYRVLLILLVLVVGASILIPSLCENEIINWLHKVPTAAHILNKYGEEYIRVRIRQTPLRFCIAIAEIAFLYLLYPSISRLPMVAWKPASFLAVAALSLYAIDWALSMHLRQNCQPLPFTSFLAGFTAASPLALAVSALLLLSTILLLKLHSWPLTLASFLMLSLLESLDYSSCHVEHTFFTFKFIVPLVLLAGTGGMASGHYQKAGWLVLAYAYHFAGLEKLINDGRGWLTGQSPQAFTQALAHSGFTGLLNFQVLGPATLAFQLLAPLLLITPLSRYVLVMASVAFHISDFIFLGVGGWYNTWAVSGIILAASQFRHFR